MRSALSISKTFFSSLSPGKNMSNKFLLAWVSAFLLDMAILTYNSKIDNIVNPWSDIKVEKKDLSQIKDLWIYVKSIWIELTKEDLLSGTDLWNTWSTDIFKILDPDKLVSDINKILESKIDKLEIDIDEDKLLSWINEIISKKLEDEGFIEKLYRIDKLEWEDRVFSMYHMFFRDLFPFILLFLYTVAYMPTINKVRKDKIAMPITSFSHFAIVSTLLGINNWLEWWSIWYAGTAILATYTVILSLMLEKKSFEIPDIPWLNDFLWDKSDEYIDNILKLWTNNTCVLDKDLNIHWLSDSLKELTWIDNYSDDKIWAYDLFWYSKELKKSLEWLLSWDKQILEKMDISLENGTEISISWMNNSYENWWKEYLIIYVSPKVV